MKKISGKTQERNNKNVKKILFSVTWCKRVYRKLPNISNSASVFQNNRRRNHFTCRWFTTEPVLHLRVVQLTWNFGSRPKIIFYLFSFWPTVTALATPLSTVVSSKLCQNRAWGPPKRLESHPHSLLECPESFWVPSNPSEVTNRCITQQYTMSHNSTL